MSKSLTLEIPRLFEVTARYDDLRFDYVLRNLSKLAVYQGVEQRHRLSKYWDEYPHSTETLDEIVNSIEYKAAIKLDNTEMDFEERARNQFGEVYDYRLDYVEPGKLQIVYDMSALAVEETSRFALLAQAENGSVIISKNLYIKHGRPPQSEIVPQEVNPNHGTIMTLAMQRLNTVNEKLANSL